MGATDFQTTATGRTADEAYRNAREEANAENGHQDGYSGDIQTTSGFRVIPDAYLKGLRMKTRIRILELVALNLSPFPNEFYGASLKAWGKVNFLGESQKGGRCYAIKIGPREWTFCGWAAS